MEHNLEYISSPDVVPAKAFNVVFKSLEQVKRKQQYLPDAKQIIVGDKDVTQLLKGDDPEVVIDQLQRSGYCKPATLQTELSQLTNDEMSLVFENNKQKPLSQYLEEVSLMQRYGSNVQVRNKHETMLVAAKGLTRLVFDKSRNTKVKMFPLHGNTEIEINGIKHILDFGQDCVSVNSSDHDGKIEIEAELPVLVLVENNCAHDKKCGRI